MRKVKQARKRIPKRDLPKWAAPATKRAAASEEAAAGIGELGAVVAAQKFAAKKNEAFVRFPREYLARAEGLVPLLAARPEVQALRASVSAAAVLRLAALHGLEMLEREYAEQRRLAERETGVGGTP